MNSTTPEGKDFYERIERAFASVQPIENLGGLTQALWTIPCFIKRETIMGRLGDPAINIEMVSPSGEPSTFVGASREDFDRKMDFDCFKRFLVVLSSTDTEIGEASMVGISHKTSTGRSAAESLLQSVTQRKKHAKKTSKSEQQLDASASARRGSGAGSRDPLEKSAVSGDHVSWADVGDTIEEEFGIPIESVVAAIETNSSTTIVPLGRNRVTLPTNDNSSKPKQLTGSNSLQAKLKKTMDSLELEDLLSESEDGDGAGSTGSITESDVCQLADVRAAQKIGKQQAIKKKKQQQQRLNLTRAQSNTNLKMGFSVLNWSTQGRPNMGPVGAPLANSTNQRVRGPGQHPVFDMNKSRSHASVNPMDHSARLAHSARLGHSARPGQARPYHQSASPQGDGDSEGELDRRSPSVTPDRNNLSRRSVGVKTTDLDEKPPYERCIDRGLKGHCYIKEKAPTKEEWNDFLIVQADMQRAKVSKIALERLKVKQERDRAIGKDMSGWRDPVPRLPTLDDRERTVVTPNPSTGTYSSQRKVGSERRAESAQQLVVDALLTTDVNDFRREEKHNRKRLWRTGGPQKAPVDKDSQQLVVEPESLVKTVYFKAQKAALIPGPDSEFQKNWGVPKRKQLKLASQTADRDFSAEF